MKIVDSYGKSFVARKISINNFIKLCNLRKTKEQNILFHNFIQEYEIDFAISHFCTCFGDHQRQFYSNKNNSLILTVQPYFEMPELIEKGFIKFDKSKSWYFPNNTFLYIKEIKQ